ncbi:hypothetical protein [Dokdonia sp. Hel_I_53]|uniref:hypothetical protein n=1 Tax=Dokdonia sp. Hel_I_53 TaxID=1566287 RepID=UPI00119B0C7B|nr:hypothetical protein [Dokdonia sp. Hel_I_53]TVZ52059.1 hypothetical protein OD90_1222 [Dokdonia sp. Hel_I_53]
MKNKFRIFLFALVGALSITFISCDDDETGVAAGVDTIPEFRNGVFVRFADGETAPATVSYSEPDTAGFTATIEDFNGNAVSYSLDVNATIAGNTQIAEDVFVVTSFPSELRIDLPTIASALGLTLDQISFGDSFSFVATATDADGNESVGILPSFDDETGIIGIGNTNDPLLNSAFYNSAMNFAFTLACPAFTVEDVVGTYNVTAQAFFPDSGADLIREVVAGPGDNQVTIVGGEYLALGSDDLIITFDPSSGSVTAVNDDGVSLPASAGFGVNTYLLENGLVLPCAGTGVIDLRLNFTPLNGNPHDFILVKQ